MKSFAPWLVSLFVGLASLAAADRNVGPPELSQFLKSESVRLDSKFLDGITNRQQWEAKHPQLRREYLESLGLWPIPERTPLETKITGMLERNEGFRVEKLHFQSRPRLYVTGNL